MPDWNDDLEAEEERTRRKDVRRAVLGGVAGVAMLVAPIILANTLVPADSSDDVKAEDSSGTTLAALRRQAEDQQAAQENARAEAATALRTTTTPPPPPPPPPTTTTTEPPTTTTTTPPATEPGPPSSGSGEYADPYDYATWDRLAECESGGNWATNTGNGYYGGIQFSLSTWESLGGTGLPSDHPRETQIQMGIKLWERAGWGQWPACTAELGYR